MATFIFLSNDPSDVSGYKKAYIGTRSPNASLTPSSTVTNTTANILTTVDTMTLTAGGSTAQWLTMPLLEAVTISNRPMCNLWGLESNALANAQIAFALSQYTTSLQTAFLTTSIGAELSTSTAQIQWISSAGTSSSVSNRETLTSTAFSAGDRLAIVGGIGGYSGQTGTSQTVTMYYNALAGTPYPGDTWILMQENLRAQDPQVGTGESAPIPGVGVSYFYDLETRLNNAVGAGLIASNASVQMVIDQANQAKDNV